MSATYRAIQAVAPGKLQAIDLAVPEAPLALELGAHRYIDFASCSSPDNRRFPNEVIVMPWINLTLRRGALSKSVQHALMARLTDTLMWWEKVP
jgi:hypothetical protein